MSIRKIQVNLLEVLILLMPYHYILFAVLFKNISIFKLWRDIIMILIIILGLVKSKRIRYDSSLIIDFLFVLWNIFYIVTAPDKFKAINIARVYLIPILLFHGIKNLYLSKHEIQKIGIKVMYNTIIICAYGLMQAYILGPSFLIRLGYGKNGSLQAAYYLSNYSGHILGSNIQRVVSTFSSANICAFYLCSIFILFLFVKDYINVSRQVYNVFMCILIITIILTFSRSSWLAIGISLIVSGRKQLMNFIVRRMNIILTLFFIALIALFASNSLRNALIHILMSSFSGTDTSIVSHYSTIENAIKLIRNNPSGLGLGENGPRALNYGNSNLVESSFLLMAFEYGVIGAAFFLYDYIFLAVGAIKNRKIDKKISELSLCLVTFTLIAYFNIPYVQEIECTSIFFIFCGIAYCKIHTKRNISRFKKLY